MRGSLEIAITETGDGDFVAACGPMQAQAPTPDEAERLLLDIIDTRYETVGSEQEDSILTDPDEVFLDTDPEG